MLSLKTTFGLIVAGLVLLFQFAIGAENDELAVSRLEFNRTVSCVRGNLPMEIQFPQKSIFPIFNATTTLDEYIAELSKVVGPPTTTLLARSAQLAWSTMDQRDITNVRIADEFYKRFYANVASNGPQFYHVGDCGNSQLVEDTILENISTYFGRAASSTGGVWEEKLPLSVRHRKTGMLMFLVSIKLAGINIDTTRLLSGFE
ncbi:hypothetical protein AAKU67_004431 [Oxalobacteraceae bacterium GrIS 2.11]